ncbi:MAG: CPBP family intramembrane metalloprotease [Paludibacteraceae bacterium]|nr:CPBP family intramembrane metalloprotease [Paludibacteraceae bacterium]
MNLFQVVAGFARKDFDKKSMVYVLLMAALCIFLNYHFHLYQQFIRTSYEAGHSLWVLPLYYFSFYMLGAIPVLVFRKRTDLLANPIFYLKSAFYIGIYGMTIGYYGYLDWPLEKLGCTSLETHFLYRCIYFSKSTIGPLLFLLLAKFTFDRYLSNFYGIGRSSAYIGRYLLLVACILPFVAAASFMPSFQVMYPVFKPWNYEPLFGLPDCGKVLLFDSCYSLHYVGVELAMRGALVIGMASLMGKDAVLPMAFMYCTLHFGKPLVETITSLFGGYILGALAYETKHIWGGILLHLGVAFGIDTAGILQHYLH